MILLCRTLGLVLALVLASAVFGETQSNAAKAICSRDTGPVGITAVDWFDSEQAKIALQKQGLSKIRFLTHDGKLLQAYVYRPSRFDTANGPIWFVMHGVKRNADYYAEVAASEAERYQALTIVIEFSHRHYPSSENYTLGITTQGKADARALREGRYLSPDAYVFNEIERFFEAVKSTLGSNQPGYYLFGHSAGAQFVHRMLTFVPCARALGAVAANAGWYTLPIVDNQKNQGMPYSLRGAPVESIDLKALLSAPLSLLLGTQDIQEAADDRNVRNTPGAKAQGVNRLERGHYYFDTGKSLAHALKIPFAWQLFHVPGAQHDVRQMIASASYVLFASKVESICTPSNKEETAKLLIQEVMIDLPAYTKNNRNRKSHQQYDQLVRIVNTDKSSVCLSGWTLQGANQKVKYLFPLDRSLAPGKGLVVFWGNTSIDDFGDSIVQRSTASNGLHLNPGGDVLTLRDANNEIVHQFSWGNCGGKKCSADYWPNNLHIGTTLTRSLSDEGKWQYKVKPQ